MSIGQNIKKYRKEKGFTQRELADLIGVSVQAISKWETNAGAPDISQVVPLASALNISTDELFDYTCRENSEDFENVKKEYYPQSVFRDQSYSDKNYALLYPYFVAHPQNPEAASLCLKCLVDMIVAGKIQKRSKGELITECEKYAKCIFKYETDADAIFMNRFVLARGYSALGEHEKAKEILQKIPITFGDRLYWEAEIAQANKEFDDAMFKCRASFALKARYVSRCIRMAGEICQARDQEKGIVKRMEYEEYMLRLINAFLSGGDYLPCRQVFQKNLLLLGMVRKYIKLEQIDLAIERAEMLFEGREQFLAFLKAPEGRTSLLFENNDSFDEQMEIMKALDGYVKSAVRYLKEASDSDNKSKIQALLQKYNLT